MATIVKGKNPNKPHTVRYYDPDTRKQREKSFAKLPEAKRFKAEVEVAIARGTFVDPKTANRKLDDVAQGWLARHPGTPKTKEVYEIALRLHILPELGARSLADVSNDREGVERFLRQTLPDKGLGASVVRTCYNVLMAIVNDAIRAGKLHQTRIKGIKLPAAIQRAEFVFASREQISDLAAGIPDPWQPTIWLMRGCGLRLGEALGIRGSDLSIGSLRVKRQLAPNGLDYIPLKHRNGDDFRDVPMPGYVLGNIHGEGDIPPIPHRTYRKHFNDARDAAGLPKEFTPHMLRHTFASVALSGGVPITDVSKWLGHRSIQVTYGIYGHLVPVSWDRARAVLDEEWSQV